MQIHKDIEQGTPEWHQLRRGKATASQFGRIITPKQMKASASRWNLIDELIAQCLFENLDEFNGSQWTDRGNELEPEARAAYWARS